MIEHPRRPDVPRPPRSPDVIDIPAPDINPAPPPDVRRSRCPSSRSLNAISPTKVGLERLGNSEVLAYCYERRQPERRSGAPRLFGRTAG